MALIFVALYLRLVKIGGHTVYNNIVPAIVRFSIYIHAYMFEWRSLLDTYTLSTWKRTRTRTPVV